MGMESSTRTDDKILRESMYIEPKSVDPDRHIRAKYFVEGTAPMNKLAEESAIENSTGTWTLVGYETLEVRKKYGAKIFKVSGSNGSGFIELAFEAENYDPYLGGVNCLLSDIAGNIFDMKILDNVKLLNLDFPDYWLDAYKGPKFGVEGTKKVAGIANENRPVVGSITKPNIGLDAKTYGKLAYETALGGIDFIKDDEAIVSPKYCPLEDRVTETMAGIDRAKQQTGKSVLYAVNITTRQDKLLELADKAISAGANHLMVCGPYIGFGGLQALAEDPSVKVPIHCHRVGHAAFTRNAKHGIDVSLWSKLMRMCGADQLHIGSVEGKFYYDESETQRNITALRQPWRHVRSTMPCSSAGNRPGNIGANVKTLGTDMMFLAGGGIHGHPDGSTAGAKAMMQAVRAALADIPLEQAARENKELARALPALQLTH
jgi:ribulose-bisphosphate carboxylase large chain